MDLPSSRSFYQTPFSLPKNSHNTHSSLHHFTLFYLSLNKADWTQSKNTYLVDQLKAQQAAGKHSDTGWKKEAWKTVINTFNRHFDVENDIKQLKSQMSQLKKQYKTVKKLQEQSGFG